MEGELKNQIKQKESSTPTPRPELLDVVAIDGRWAQVLLQLEDESRIIFLSEKAKTGRNKKYEINWDKYKYEKIINGRVGTLRERGEISKEEYMAVYWGDEQKNNPMLRDCVTVFGKYTIKNKRNTKALREIQIPNLSLQMK